MYTAALFDMDGTLLDSETQVVAACHFTAEQLGLGDLTAVFHQMIGLRGDLSEALLRKALPAHVTFEQFDQIWSGEYKRRKSEGVALKPGAQVLLEHFRSQGIPCALATSTRIRDAEATLERAGIDTFFDFVIGGDQVTQPKPAPEIYATAAQALGMAPATCLAFEDSDPGTQAAVAAGCKTAQIPDIKQPAPETRALGHVIAPDLLAAARALGVTGL